MLVMLVVLVMLVMLVVLVIGTIVQLKLSRYVVEASHKLKIFDIYYELLIQNLFDTFWVVNVPLTFVNEVIVFAFFVKLPIIF